MEIPEPILKLAASDPVVAVYVKLFQRGQYATLADMLVALVVAMNSVGRITQDNYLAHLQACRRPIIVIKLDVK